MEKRYRLKDEKKSTANKDFYYGRKGDVVTIISESEMDRLCIVESQANIINNIKVTFSIHWKKLYHQKNKKYDTFNQNKKRV